MLQARELLLSVLQIELQLADQDLETLVPGNTPGHERRRTALGEELDRTQMEHFVHGQEQPLEGDADDGDAADIAHGADARLAPVCLVRVEPHHDVLEMLADGERRPARRPLEGDAVLRHVVQDVREGRAGSRELYLATNREELRCAVAVRAEEDLAALAALQFLVGADQRRDGRGETDSLERCEVEQTAEEKPQLVTRPLRFRGEPPASSQLAAL